MKRQNSRYKHFSHEFDYGWKERDKSARRIELMEEFFFPPCEWDNFKYAYNVVNQLTEILRLGGYLKDPGFLT